MHIGACSPDSNRRAAIGRLLLEGFSSLDAAPAAIGHGLALTAAEFRVSDFVSLVELHPCQQAASHLACTRPPNCMLIGITALHAVSAACMVKVKDAAHLLLRRDWVFEELGPPYMWTVMLSVVEWEL
jgi:hypothetical protein